MESIEVTGTKSCTQIFVRNICNEDDLIVLTKCLQFQCQSKCYSKPFFPQTKENHCFVMETKVQCRHFLVAAEKRAVFIAT
jgi:hypothetical protein